MISFSKEVFHPLKYETLTGENKQTNKQKWLLFKFFLLLQNSGKKQEMYKNKKTQSFCVPIWSYFLLTAS